MKIDKKYHIKRSQQKQGFNENNSIHRSGSVKEQKAPGCKYPKRVITLKTTGDNRTQDQVCSVKKGPRNRQKTFKKNTKT